MSNERRRMDRHDSAAEKAAPQTQRSRGASEIKHPSMRRTRAYFARHPLPEQRSGGMAS